MVKHIKKSYKKDGKLTDDEKSIAYATAWKNYNKKESFEIDKTAHKAAQKKAKLRNLAKGNTNPNEKAAAEKKAGGPKLMGEGKKWDSYKKAVATVLGKKKEQRTAQKKQKMRNLAKGNTNPNEKAAAEKKAGGPKLMGEGKRWDSYKKAVATVLGKKKEQKKPEKAMDAGARAKRKLQRKVHATYVSGSEDNVPDEIRD